jgi:hypothetical protein
MYENRVLRRIFGSKREKVTGEWMKLHTQSFIIYPSPNIVEMGVAQSV